MSKKRQATRTIGFQEAEENTPALSLEELANSGYGDLSSLTRGSGRMIARPTNIFEIQPDLNQPRRVIPSQLRGKWDGDPNNLDKLFNVWLEETNKERGDNGFDIDAYIANQEDFIQIPEPGPVESSFLAILELAVSIRRDGLTNPITIAQNGAFFTIETGERRWLAYHLLNAYFGDSDKDEGGNPREWKEIPARLVEAFDVWRQASENTARANLNAIGKARQFSVLLMSLYGTETFQSIGECETEQDFYAQVADGKTYPIPRGQGTNILNAMGLRDKSQIRRHRDLLRLPSVVWQWADDLNWAEGRIRKLVSKAKNEDELIQAAALEASREGLGVPIGTLPKPLKLSSVKPPYTRGKKLATITDRERFKLLLTIGEGVTGVNDATKRMLLREVELHKQWLNRLEKRLKN